MRIRILRQTSINGQPARVGEVIDAAEADARTLLLMRKAELAPEPDPTPAPIVAPAATDHRKPRTRKG